MDDDQDIIPAAVIERYEYCMAIFEESGQRRVVSSLEMWNALLEIYSRQLWRARFSGADEWVKHVAELGYTGMSRSTIYGKLARMRGLISQGVKQELAAAAVATVPGAMDMINSEEEFRAAVGEHDPNEYINEVILLSPGEAIKRVRLDKGNTVEMWFAELAKGKRTGEIAAVIVRSDGKRGYTAYDMRVTITPQIPANQDMVDIVTSWATRKIGGSSDSTTK